MTRDYLEHVTTEGERWDQLAWRYYGDPYRYEPLIAGNPDVLIVPVLPGGLTLRVPFLGEEIEELAAESLPPWKRARPKELR